MAGGDVIRKRDRSARCDAAAYRIRSASCSAPVAAGSRISELS